MSLATEPIHGTLDGTPTTAVIIEEADPRDPTLHVFLVHLFQVRDREPHLVAWGSDPTSFLESAAWSFTDDGLVRYSQGIAMGAGVEDAWWKYPYDLYPAELLPAGTRYVAVTAPQPVPGPGPAPTWSPGR
jgi:hypothetical protein